jgi:APA family basic amino acid/polyamine antiporter
MSSTSLERRLGVWSALGVVVGITIGSGIFRTPAVIAGRVPDPLLMLAVWILGGAITLCGALSIAELAASLPRTGGLYVYLREGWGRPVAFLFGWAQLVLIRASALGGIASVFGDYCLRSFGVSPDQHAQLSSLLAAGCIVFAASVNIMGVEVGAAIVGASTVAKYGALIVLIVMAFSFGHLRGADPAHFTAGAGDEVQAGLFGLALISVLWAYDGFADLSFAGGEVREPQRTLPRALVGGTAAIVAVYLLANAAYLYVSPIDRVASSPLIAADTMLALVGQAGVVIVSVVVMVSTFGSVNGSLLANPRIFFAMADDKLFFAPIARVHPRFKTPYVAILLAAALGVWFVLTRTFEQLTDTFVLAMWPFYGLSVAAIYRLRRSRPDLPRPYLTVGYPVVPAIFIAGVLYLVISALVADPLPTAAVFAVVLAGLPVYWLFFRQRG